jgi:hypothetical protein
MGVPINNEMKMVTINISSILIPLPLLHVQARIFYLDFAFESPQNGLNDPNGQQRKTQWHDQVNVSEIYSGGLRYIRVFEHIPDKARTHDRYGTYEYHPKQICNGQQPALNLGRQEPQVHGHPNVFIQIRCVDDGTVDGPDKREPGNLFSPADGLAEKEPEENLQAQQ